MEVAFFPSLLGSNLQTFTPFPLPISPGIHHPDNSKAWTKLDLAISSPSKDPNQESSLLRLWMVAPVGWHHLPSASHFRERDSPIVAPGNQSGMPFIQTLMPKIPFLRLRRSYSRHQRSLPNRCYNLQLTSRQDSSYLPIPGQRSDPAPEVGTEGGGGSGCTAPWLRMPDPRQSWC